MTPDSYILWHGTRGGWVANVGTSSNREDAIRFDREKALAYVARNKDHTGAFTVLPINEADLI